MAVTVGTKKWVYLFEEGDGSMRDLLGGKGAGLAEMTKAGLPVPPGFTITTDACNAYYSAGNQFPSGLWDQVLESLKLLEQKAGKKLGDRTQPLLVSVRSGAKFSMPGMMDTVLNLGLNDVTVENLAQQTGNRRFALDAYRRFIQMFGKVVLGIDAAKFEQILERQKEQARVSLDTELDEADLEQVVDAFKDLVTSETGKAFPQDVTQQLRLAIEAVFKSWNNKRAIDYRNFHKIPHDLGTACNIVGMVFGNMGEDSGTGVAFTRDPATGEKVLFGEYLPNAQGEDVVAGIRTPLKISELKDRMPEVYQQFETIARRLEEHYRDAQDLEFTVERGKLYMLQTRSAKRTAQAAVKIAVDMVREGLITKEDAIRRVEPAQVYQLLLPNFDPKAKQQAEAEGRLLAKGINASPGAASGKAVFNADRAERMGEAGEKVILIRPETNPDDVHGMIAAVGILTARGGATSHAAVVARGLGKACVAGCESIRVLEERRCFRVGQREVCEGDEISIDGTTGEVFLGIIPTMESDFEKQPDLRQLLEWANEIKRLGVWANADYPRDAARAVQFGAEGIGLCRTEHMFFETERLPVVHKMILAAADASAIHAELRQAEDEFAIAATGNGVAAAAADRLRTARERFEASPAVRAYFDALKYLEQVQKEDFRGILKEMAGKPVVIRLIDPPLHEFLPSAEELLIEVMVDRIKSPASDQLKEKEELLAAVQAMHEQNPMLGLRGCRLGLLYPEIVEMQVKAILTAAGELANEGIDVRPEIMIPLVGHVNEIKELRAQLERVASEVENQLGTKIPYKFGTMIEVPRACATAGEIAQYTEFFSFGTNDLTQSVFGYSRDDAERKFLMQYIDRGILPANPFQSIDRDGVGQFVRMAFERGRAARPDLKIGICGEHGGDPASVDFFHQIGLDYVSCSPFRVPVARIAAAQAALSQLERDR